MRLRALLDTYGETFDSFAARLGVDPKTVERWVYTNRSPYRSIAVKAARLLQVDVTYLWPNLYNRHNPNPVTPYVPVPDRAPEDLTVEDLPAIVRRLSEVSTELATLCQQITQLQGQTHHTGCDDRPVHLRLRAERIKRLWSQKAMAVELRNAADEETRACLPSIESLQRYVRGYEAGLHQPGDLYAELYCRAFGLSHDALFGERPVSTR